MSVSFSELPIEIHSQIASQLSPKQIAQTFVRLSKYFKSVGSANSLWAQFFQKEYLDHLNTIAHEQKKTICFKDAFSKAPLEAIAAEYLYLHQITIELTKLCEPDDKAAEKLIAKALENVDYASCILLHPPLLEIIFRSSDWEGSIQSIVEMFKETALYPLKNYKLFEKHYELLRDALPQEELVGFPEFITGFAEQSSRAALYFLKTQVLIDIIIDHPGGPRMLKEIAKTSSEAAIYLLSNPRLIEILLKDKEQEAYMNPQGLNGYDWIVQVALKFEESTEFFMQNKWLKALLEGAGEDKQYIKTIEERHEHHLRSSARRLRTGLVNQ